MAEPPVYLTNTHMHPLASGVPPHWACGWGQDRYGPFVEISVQAAKGGERVVQRLRWIPPGEFTMGSPDDEPGRYDHEGPQHRVRLTDGFWMFDTPVTQAFWQAISGDNPSEFVSPDRPVENVSFDDAQQFLERINSRYPGLELALPSEAQWEYACRAGTEEATYAGPIDIHGENNAPVLNGIAWYGGNSSDGFNLDNGVDCSGWEEKAIDGDRAGTHPVAGKWPNQWGLYDMLGNVFEWCDSGWTAYQGERLKDPPRGGDASSRVVRGGSWAYIARFVRAASRYHHVPGIRNYDLGFRCLRVQRVNPGGSRA